MRILLDHDHGSAGNKVVGDKIEDFELIYKWNYEETVYNLFLLSINH